MRRPCGRSRLDTFPLFSCERSIWRDRIFPHGAFALRISEQLLCLVLLHRVRVGHDCNSISYRLHPEYKYDNWRFYILHYFPLPFFFFLIWRYQPHCRRNRRNYYRSSFCGGGILCGSGGLQLQQLVQVQARSVNECRPQLRRGDHLSSPYRKFDGIQRPVLKCRSHHFSSLNKSLKGSDDRLYYAIDKVSTSMWRTCFAILFTLFRLSCSVYLNPSELW